MIRCHLCWFGEPASRPLRRRCRFRVGHHREVVTIPFGPVCSIAWIGNQWLYAKVKQWLVVRELWWAGYVLPCEPLVHMEAQP